MRDDSCPVMLTLKPCVPAKQFELSKRFYMDVGFRIVKDSQKAAELEMDDCRFVLQNFFDSTRGQFCMVELVVADLNDWWGHLQRQDLDQRYNVRRPDRLDAASAPPSILLHDPSGVVWRIRESEGDNHGDKQEE